MGQKLKNLVIARKKLASVPTDPVPAEFTASDEVKLDAAMDYLKETVVNDDNLVEIKSKMIETMGHRTKLMKDQRMDIKEAFPFLFASVDLVSEFIIKLFFVRLVYSI